MSSDNGIEFVPDSTTGYKVLKDGEEIGRVSRNFRERNQNLWRYYAPNGASAEVKTRQKAVECLLEFQGRGA